MYKNFNKYPGHDFYKTFRDVANINPYNKKNR